MSDRVTLLSSTRAEWIKFRTVRSTVMGFVVTIILTVGLGALITTAIRGHWNSMDPIRKLTFDPVSSSLGGILFAQFAIGVIGTLFVTSEYSSGSIRSTLAAVPQRPLLVASKLVVLAVSTFVVGELVCFATFLMGQAIFSGVVPTALLSDGAVLRSVVLAGIYLTLLAVLGFALGLILRQSAACISTFTSLLLVLPIITFLLPSSWQNAVSKFEPSALGHAMMSTSPPDQMFGAWTATGILLGYVVIVLGAGLTLMVRRDA
ncbi:MAG TPA: ABC transporter permease subunit [Acidimicrobiales bacterium]|nr:ABC transporter permease subunit [Acidimicrobiales bacterium]